MRSESVIIERVARVVEALRDELQQYGEMLALLDLQREALMVRAAGAVMQSVVAVREQMGAIHASRVRRVASRSELARALGQPEDAPFSLLVPMLRGSQGVAVEALVAENNALLAGTRRRARQNHLMLGRSVESMQQFMNALTPPARNDGGQAAPGDGPAHCLGEAAA